MKRYIKSALAPAAALLISLASTSCLNDLDKEPISPKIDLNVNNDGLLNKCYANFGINGNGSGTSCLPTRLHAHGATVCRSSTRLSSTRHTLG